MGGASVARFLKWNNFYFGAVTAFVRFSCLAGKSVALQRLRATSHLPRKLRRNNSRIKCMSFDIEVLWAGDTIPELKRASCDCRHNSANPSSITCHSSEAIGSWPGGLGDDDD